MTHVLPLGAATVTRELCTVPCIAEGPAGFQSFYANSRSGDTPIRKFELPAGDTTIAIDPGNKAGQVAGSSGALLFIPSFIGVTLALVDMALDDHVLKRADRQLFLGGSLGALALSTGMIVIGTNSQGEMTIVPTVAPQ